MTSKLKSDVDIYAMVLLGDEMIVDKLRMDLNENGNCVEQLRFQLNATSARVRDKVAMTIDAKPGSLCAVSAIDQSLLFMGKQNHLNAFMLLEQLAKNKPKTNDKDKQIMDQKKKNYHENEYNMSDLANPIEIFRHSSLLYFTNYQLEGANKPNSHNNELIFITMTNKPNSHNKSDDEVEEDDVTVLDPNDEDNENADDDLTRVIRDYFPESWLWSIHRLNETGHFSAELKVPDSITKWNFNAYCLNKENGIEFSASRRLKIVQDFFLSLHMPYEVKQGEKFQAQVAVHNNLDQVLPIIVKLKINDGFMRIEQPVAIRCVYPNERITDISFELTAENFTLNDEPLNITAYLQIMKKSVCGGDNNKSLFNTSGKNRLYDYERRSIRILVSENKKWLLILLFYVCSIQINWIFCFVFFLAAWRADFGSFHENAQR